MILHPSKSGLARVGIHSASNLSLTLIPQPTQMPDGPACVPVSTYYIYYDNVNLETCHIPAVKYLHTTTLSSTGLDVTQCPHKAD